MRSSAEFLSPADAAKRLGVSTKALRLYERHGLMVPTRTAAGWRTYGPVEIARAAEIVALRALGLSLADVTRVLRGGPERIAPVLAAHEAALEGRIRQLTDMAGKVRGLRAELVRDTAPTVDALARHGQPAFETVDFDLPWPWGGERFELRDIRPLNYIIGPLGSGKTRLARALADALPGAGLVGLDRLADGGAQARALLDADKRLRSRVNRTVTRLRGDGAVASAALTALLAALESEGPGALIVDMVEDGLDRVSQEALIAHLRRRKPGARPLFLLTRSNAILDLAVVGPDEAIILCPANHSPPTRVAPYPGAPGYEAVATCLASPEVRARTQGVIAWRPPGAPGLRAQTSQVGNTD